MHAMMFLLLGVITVVYMHIMLIWELRKKRYIINRARDLNLHITFFSPFLFVAHSLIYQRSVPPYSLIDVNCNLYKKEHHRSWKSSSPIFAMHLDWYISCWIVLIYSKWISRDVEDITIYVIYSRSEHLNKIDWFLWFS